MSKVLTSVLPMVAGLVIGGPLGAAVGGELGIGAGAGMDIASVLGGAAVGAGTSALMGGNALTGALGGAGGGLGSAFGGVGGLMGAASGAPGAGALSTIASASDPIEALSNAMTITGTSTATDAAQALGYSSTNALLTAANPSWLTTPAAIQGGMSNATGGLVGGANSPQVGSFTGTAGSVPQSNPASMMSMLAGGKGAGLGPLSSLMSIGSGVYGLNNAMQMEALAKQMAGAGSQYSGQYASMLNKLVNNPNTITSMPGYQSGLEAVQRSMASQGYQGSGNMAAALQQYGGNFYNSQVNQLQSLAQSGSQQGASAIQAGAAANQSASSALAALGYGATGLGF